MSNWFKKTSLSTSEENFTETWIREENEDSKSFDVDIYLGKKTDLISLKKDIVKKIKDNIKRYQESRTKLFSESEMENVEECPVCESSSKNIVQRSEIYGAKYCECTNCSHVYLIERPTNKAIHNFYLNDVTYAATYTDKAAAESRLNAIAVPWLEWTSEVYEKEYGRKPKKILDVGSGAGHFVEACRRAGIEAYGIELSQSSRDFAKEIWGFEMDDKNFIDTVDDYSDVDIITFWGLLEHTPNPSEILNTAKKILEKNGNNEGMVIAKIPRWDSLSSAIQRLSPDTIIRHLDPMGHIMAFTDESASELYYKNGFTPAAAWYYGMDVYETLMQIGNHIDEYEHFTKTGKLQMELQQFIDNKRFSDGLTLVGKI